MTFQTTKARIPKSIASMTQLFLIQLIPSPAWGEMRGSNSRVRGHDPVPIPLGQSHHVKLCLESQNQSSSPLHPSGFQMPVQRVCISTVGRILELTARIELATVRLQNGCRPFGLASI